PGGATLTGPVFYTVVGRISAAPSGILLAKKKRYRRSAFVF
ncbi:hypothetical protein HMPREF3207_03678, partial [Citrobacter koseri]